MTNRRIVDVNVYQADNNWYVHFAGSAVLPQELPDDIKTKSEARNYVIGNSKKHNIKIKFKNNI